ncbi:MAG: thymidine phosphorylase, partial [Actinomycetota bacterium]|nr:thymidine phosphorylase [Actinomycetota bacterium]
REDPVQAAAGVELHARPGDRVRAGEPLLTLHTDTPERFARATAALVGSWEIQADGIPEQLPLVIDRISQGE